MVKTMDTVIRCFFMPITGLMAIQYDDPHEIFRHTWRVHGQGATSQISTCGNGDARSSIWIAKTMTEALNFWVALLKPYYIIIRIFRKILKEIEGTFIHNTPGSR
jgi:hypothetical protein